MTICSGQKGYPLWVRQMPKWINFSSSLASIFGSLALIFLYFYYKPKSGKQTHRILTLFLAISDLIASTSIFISQAWLNFSSHNYTAFVCKFLRAAIEFGSIASFCWTTAMAFYLWRSLNQKPEKKFIQYAHFFCWFIPSLIVILIFTTGGFKVSDQNWCTLPGVYEYLYWFGPLSISFLTNIVLYILILNKVKKLSLQNFRVSIIRRILLYLIVFFICWVWDFVDHIMSSFKCDYFPFFILEVFFSPLQGLLNAIVYGVSKSRETNQSTFVVNESESELDINVNENSEEKKLILIKYGTSESEEDN
eukprot:TRINITY_DN1693_c8_g1_i1.p1 TRINITY_DN1693_c8_g1~~TRINITY_DN1693_c8_g1_i1.p1  ORF type:complete len:307 (-),score=61.33 TRINITY_DN1693_c8_g1_i1:55-975(-)